MVDFHVDTRCGWLLWRGEKNALPTLRLVCGGWSRSRLRHLGQYALCVVALAIGLAGSAYACLHVAMMMLGPPPLDELQEPSEARVKAVGLSDNVRADAEPRKSRSKIGLSDVDPLYLTMLLAFEDKNYFSHSGIDPAGIVRAGLHLIREGRIVSGGSTLTMQVARLLDRRYERSFSNKFRQIVRAIQLEENLTKNELLELYLRLAPFGGGLQGVRSASLSLFKKEPRHLSPGEAALLVALPQAPEARRVDRHAEVALRARNHVLDRVVAAGVLSPAAAAHAKSESMPVLHGNSREHLIRVSGERPIN